MDSRAVGMALVGRRPGPPYGRVGLLPAAAGRMADAVIRRIRPPASAPG